MNYLDYRQKLGVGFDDKRKTQMLKSKIKTFFDALNNTQFIRNNFDTNDFYIYYINVGEYVQDVFYTWHNLALSIIDEDEISGVISKYIVLINNLDGIFYSECWEFNEYKEMIKDFLYETLDSLKIQYETIKDKDGIFIFPKGAKELDDALVSEPLEWLKVYPQAHSTFCRALRQYSNGDYARDVADNFRKALEEFLQEFLENEKNLETNKNEICKYLGEQGADANIGAMLNTLLNSYKNLNDKVVKHNDKVDEKFLEFLMYQTGLFIRMIITTCK